SGAVSIGAAVAVNSIDNQVGAWVNAVDHLEVTGNVDPASIVDGYAYVANVQLTPDIWNGTAWVPATYGTQVPLLANTGRLSISSLSTATVTSTAQMAAV